jgi:hypothetical protein
VNRSRHESWAIDTGMALVAVPGLRTWSSLEGASVGQLRERGLFVLAILGADDCYAANPPDERQLVAGETCIASGSAEALAAARSGPGDRGRSQGVKPG